MESLSALGFAEYYYLDNDKIYNAKIKKYMKECGEYRYKLRTKEGKQKNITIKEIYRRLYNRVFCIDEVERYDGEEFREIEGTGGNYFVSNMGRIMSYMSNHATILKPTITPQGYERLTIIIDGQKYNKFVHSCVAKEWLERPKNIEQMIHHIDYNKRNNRSDNLMYVNPIEHSKIHCERRKECQNTTAIQIKEV